MKTKLHIECPLCGGSGEIEAAQKVRLDDSETKKEMIKELYDKGYGIRQLARIFGYSSPASIQIIVNPAPSQIVNDLVIAKDPLVQVISP